MKQVLRDMRYLAVEMARWNMPIEAKRLLALSVRFPTVKASEQVREWRTELLIIGDKLSIRNLPNLQDVLSVILTQLRRLEYSLKD